MTPQAIKKLTNILLGFVGLTLIYFLISTIIDGYFIWGANKIDFAVTGQVGDFIGGFLGTIINGAAFYFLYLTLNEQRKSSEKQSFETKLFELIHLHRENVSELRYTKSSHEAESRKVFRVIAKEFIECLHEVQRFSKMYNDIEAINPVYRASLERIRQSNGFSASVEELAAIDLAYNFLYFGSSHESDTVILHKFFRRYKKEYGHRLRFFMQLKLKQDNKILFDAWESFKEKDVKEMKLEFDSLYKNRARLKSAEFQNNELAKCVFSVPYYNGHQHRLGHYFRHLFQSFKFISLQNSLSADEKYFYAKSIRSQLSMYEQLILLVNSISSLGMNWEYTSENKASESTDSHNDFKFITRYNLVKNLPGSQYYGITYRNFILE